MTIETPADLPICARRCCSNLVTPPAIAGPIAKIYCSERCSRRAGDARRKARKAIEQAHARASVIAICARPGCGKPVGAPGKRGPATGYCSSACREWNANRRFDHSARRVLKAGFGAAIELFLQVEILERDGWICQRCGVETPVDLRGTFEPNAPEVDHKIPISRGGAHTRENCWCLCHRCNQKKGNKLLEELPPIAARIAAPSLTP